MAKAIAGLDSTSAARTRAGWTWWPRWMASSPCRSRNSSGSTDSTRSGCSAVFDGEVVEGGHGRQRQGGPASRRRRRHRFRRPHRRLRQSAHRVGCRVREAARRVVVKESVGRPPGNDSSPRSGPRSRARLGDHRHRLRGGRPRCRRDGRGPVHRGAENRRSRSDPRLGLDRPRGLLRRDRGAGRARRAPGVPAHPGSVLWLARVGGTSILGLPTCGASMATAADLLLPRLLASEPPSRRRWRRWATAGSTQDQRFLPCQRVSWRRHRKGREVRRSAQDRTTGGSSASTRSAARGRTPGGLFRRLRGFGSFDRSGFGGF